MKKIRDGFDRLTGWVGEKLFPSADEKSRKRLAAWLLTALLCMALVGVFRYRAMQELKQYQRIADAYTILLGE